MGSIAALHMVLHLPPLTPIYIVLIAPALSIQNPDYALPYISSPCNDITSIADNFTEFTPSAVVVKSGPPTYWWQVHLTP
jgi:hypothetical protein